MYKQVIASLQQSYNAKKAIERDKGEKAACQFFEMVSFKRIQPADETRFHFQSMILRRR